MSNSTVSLLVAIGSLSVTQCGFLDNFGDKVSAVARAIPDALPPLRSVTDKVQENLIEINQTTLEQLKEDLETEKFNHVQKNERAYLPHFKAISNHILQTVEAENKHIAEVLPTVEKNFLNTDDGKKMDTNEIYASQIFLQTIKCLSNRFSHNDTIRILTAINTMPRSKNEHIVLTRNADTVERQEAVIQGYARTFNIDTKTPATVLKIEQDLHNTQKLLERQLMLKKITDGLQKE